MSEPRELEVRLLSARGESALAVILARAKAPATLRTALARLGVAALPRVGAFVLRRLELGDGIVEEALLVRPRASEFELHTHGNPRLVDRVLRALRGDAPEDPAPEDSPPEDSAPEDPAPADPAPEDAAPDDAPGEPARELRDELEAMGASILRRARAAPSRVGLEACLYQLGEDGALAHLVRDPQRTRAAFWAACRARGRALEPFLVAPRVVLRGRPNAGKSTLFNLLFGRPRVREGELAGLTRDSVEELVVLASGLPIRLVDVAGERASGQELERRAITAARRERERAALVLHVADARGPRVEPLEAGELVVYTHADLLGERERADLAAELGDASVLVALKHDARGPLLVALDRAIRRGLGVEAVEPGPALFAD